MSDPYVRQASYGDCFLLASCLRKEDAREVEASTTASPLEAIIDSYIYSEDCFTIVNGCKMVGMFGVVPTLGGGCIWMLASDELKKIRRPFLRQFRSHLNRLFEKYGELGNVVDERNTAHIRWIKWAGFEFTGYSFHRHDPSVRFLEFYKCASPSSPSPSSLSPLPL